MIIEKGEILRRPDLIGKEVVCIHSYIEGMYTVGEVYTVLSDGNVGSKLWTRSSSNGHGARWLLLGEEEDDLL